MEFVQKQPRKGFSDRVKQTAPRAVYGPEKAQKTGTLFGVPVQYAAAGYFSGESGSLDITR